MNNPRPKCCKGTKALNVALSPIPEIAPVAKFSARGGKSYWGEIVDVRYHEDKKVIVVEYCNEENDINHRIIHLDKPSPFWPVEIEAIEPPVA